jgi:hypothetical protein
LENLAASVCRVGGTLAGGKGKVDTGRKQVLGGTSKKGYMCIRIQGIMSQKKVLLQ